MATTPIDWQDAITFEDYVLRLFQEGKTDTEEFKALTRIFGKTKINGYLMKHQERSRSSKYLVVKEFEKMAIFSGFLLASRKTACSC
jgi:hypothetical protein